MWPQCRSVAISAAAYTDASIDLSVLLELLLLYLFICLHVSPFHPLCVP